MLTAAQLAELLDGLQRRYGFAPGAEISLEVDPASCDEQRLQGFLAAGVNRVSLGARASMTRRWSGSGAATAATTCCRRAAGWPPPGGEAI